MTKLTHIQRFTALVAAIDGKRPSNKRLKQFANNFLSYRRDQVEAAKLINLTNAQKASVVLDAFSHHEKSVAEAMYMRRGIAKLKANKP